MVQKRVQFKSQFTWHILAPTLFLKSYFRVILINVNTCRASDLTDQFKALAGQIAEMSYHEKQFKVFFTM